MVIYDKYDIVFQEIPNEVSLAFTLKNCPNMCEGCHSPHLREKTGSPLNRKILWKILKEYRDRVTTILFLGGDGDVDDLCELFKDINIFNHVHNANLKVAWYSGVDEIYLRMGLFLDYYKVGRYDNTKGGLDNPNTNQILYKIEDEKMKDITFKFWD